MKKLKKAVSLVAILAIMATMFAAPLGVSAADTAETNKELLSLLLSPNEQADVPTNFTRANADVTTNGTYQAKGKSYLTSNAPFGGVGDMTVGFLGTSQNGKSYLSASTFTNDADITAINGYKISGNTTLEDAAVLSDGDIIVYETTDNGLDNAGLKSYSYVTVKSLPENGIIAENASAVVGQTISAHAFTTESSYVIVMAEYDKNGNMVKIDYNSTNTISITPSTAGNTIKVFLVDNLDNIRPIADNIEIPIR